jgi:hypothetical protein
MRRAGPGTLWLSLLVAGVGGCRSTPVLESADSGVFTCRPEGDAVCEGDVAVRCERQGALIGSVRTDCTLRGERCVEGECRVCVPGVSGCFEGNPARCLADGSGWESTGTCNLEAGQACRDGGCVELCEEALADRSYVGCEFYPVDLDTQGQYFPPFGIIVSNPNPFTTHIVLEVDDAEPGQPARLRTVAESDVPASDLETFSLPRRRIDGRASGETWVETGTALTRRAYRVRSRHPVIAYQFNPLAQADVYSNDASLLLPTSALGTRTTVLGWPQTLATRGDAGQRSPNDFRGTLTVVGTQSGTEVTVRFGRAVDRVLGLEAGESWSAGESATFTLGPLDTLNLETDGFLADFTGTLVTSSAPVAIYTGSEGADVPTFDTLDARLCCADHLEDQLVPDSSLGSEFVLARTPARAASINLALADPSASLLESEEYEIVRVLAVSPGTTRIDTGLAPPFDAFTLEEGEVATLVLDRDTTLVADQPVSIIQLLASQNAVGIPPLYPGGDPALVVVPPVDQFRSDYVFLTPSTYAFDAVTIVAVPDTQILLDGAPLPGTCERRELSGPSTRAGSRWELFRCPLSFPEIGGDFAVRGGVQGDGVHRVRSDRPVGVVVSGFDVYVSYAYAAGMNLEVLR